MNSYLPVDCAVASVSEWSEVNRNPTRSSFRTIAPPRRRLQQQGRRSNAADRSPWLLVPPWPTPSSSPSSSSLSSPKKITRRSLLTMCVERTDAFQAMPERSRPQPGRMCASARRGSCDVMQLAYWTARRRRQVPAEIHCCNSS